ncbi:MAG: HAD family hydrolase [Candidatus Hodarchaeota archaeon]
MKNSTLDVLNLKEIQGFIFDLDGTLVDTMPSIVSVVIQGLQRHGVQQASTNLGERLYTQFSGSPLPQGIRMVPTLMARVGRLAGLSRLRTGFFTVETTYRLRKAYDNAKLFPEVKELLDSLYSTERSLCLVSMGSRKGIMRILKRTGIKDYFSAIISRDEVKKQKPDPEGYLIAQKAMQISPSRIVVVGDMPTDILAAKRAGMLSIAVTSGLATEEWFRSAAKPDILLQSIGALRKILDN